ncbi:Yip1 domain containing hypothetical protein [Phytophthora palmivora]|uniref:Protein YIPF n=2 Tax=Phytophthora palmivora TaxID=4796 RepID=A0A2P4X9L8_9STRA|nr:Yip1 domain containing hypothetical protein [Phytophthora palmivora]
MHYSNRNESSSPSRANVDSKPNPRRCSVPDCQKTAKRGGRCISHGGGNKCIVDGCTTSVVSRGLCVAHGGGKRCQTPECVKSAQSGGYCWIHGGGKKCGYHGCPKRAQSGGACIAHGGGKRCRIDGCNKVVQYDGLCVGHGGYRRCVVENCGRRAMANDFCQQHGGSSVCSLEHCYKRAVRGGKCSEHKAEASFQAVTSNGLSTPTQRMNMNMDPNAMSPWFTAPEGEYPPMNTQATHPNSNSSGSGFHSSAPGSSSGLSGTVGSSGYYDDEDDDNEFANEPPLLEELGINFDHIWAKTVSVLLPTKQINEHILDDADLAGPLVFCFLFGMCLLLAAKVHFGYIYGFGVLSCLFMYLLMNLLSPERTIDIYRVCSVLGYCLLPIIGLAAINIVVSVKDLGIVGFFLASVCTLWSTHTASRFFEKALYMTEQKYLVMYPTMLVYACFVLIAVF